MDYSGEKIFHRSPSGSPQHRLLAVVVPFFAMTWIAVPISGYAVSTFFRDCPFCIHVKVVVFVIRPEQGYFFPDKKPGPPSGSTDEPVSWP
jgi:hypothetical protein